MVNVGDVARQLGAEAGLDEAEVTVFAMVLNATIQGKSFGEIGQLLSDQGVGHVYREARKKLARAQEARNEMRGDEGRLA